MRVVSESYESLEKMGVAHCCQDFLVFASSSRSRVQLVWSPGAHHYHPNKNGPKIDKRLFFLAQTCRPLFVTKYLIGEI